MVVGKTIAKNCDSEAIGPGRSWHYNLGEPSLTRFLRTYLFGTSGIIASKMILLQETQRAHMYYDLKSPHFHRCRVNLPEHHLRPVEQQTFRQP